MRSMKRILVIGGGIVGLATALKISTQHPRSVVIVLEKEKQVGTHQSSHNSGVLHAGLYYRPGSAKARLAVAGIREMTEFCATHQIPHEICGKLVVATSVEEIPRLNNLLNRGTQNGLRLLRMLTREEMLEIEPHIGGIAALHVPDEGIVDYACVCEALVRLLRKRDAQIVTGARVTRLLPSDSRWTAETTCGDFEGDFLVNCAGLHCDRVSRLAGEQPEIRIVPFRGEYYRLKPERQYLVRNLIYPVPDPVFPFLGVHFTRQIRGGVEAGPNAVLAFAREGYNKWHVNIRDLYDALSFPGLWRFVAKHSAMCWGETARSFNRTLFCASLQKLVPDIREEDLMAGGAGVRAQAMSPSGELVQDFHLLRSKNAVHVLNAPSPAATACLAIGDEIARMVN